MKEFSNRVERYKWPPTGRAGLVSWRKHAENESEFPLVWEASAVSKSIIRHKTGQNHMHKAQTGFVHGQKGFHQTKVGKSELLHNIVELFGISIQKIQKPYCHGHISAILGMDEILVKIKKHKTVELKLFRLGHLQQLL